MAINNVGIEIMSISGISAGGGSCRRYARHENINGVFINEMWRKLEKSSNNNGASQHRSCNKLIMTWLAWQWRILVMSWRNPLAMSLNKMTHKLIVVSMWRNNVIMACYGGSSKLLNNQLNNVIINK